MTPSKPADEDEADRVFTSLPVGGPPGPLRARAFEIRNLAGRVMAMCGVRGMSREHADLQTKITALLTSADATAREQGRQAGAEEAKAKLEPWLEHLGVNCGGYHGDKPDECECGLLDVVRALPLPEPGK